LKDEFLKYGLGWDQFSVRREKTYEALEVITRLWTRERASFSGKYYHVTDAPFYPKSIQKPHPPIWVGGVSRTAIETLAKFGSGWIPEDPTVEQYKSSLEELERLAIQQNRAASEITPGVVLKGDVTGKARESLRDRISALADIGARHIVVYFESPAREFMRSASEFWEHVASEYE
jgi:alkanesulfonate monooxygenase SsuD/methylene tetrahydromethanopterin reductase-like flavin-dependent oxidoreductase (luciferase family)